MASFPSRNIFIIHPVLFVSAQTSQGIKIEPFLLLNFTYLVVHGKEQEDTNPQDQVSLMANVRLPQIDLRQPELRRTSNHPKRGIAPAVTDKNVGQWNSSAERSNKDVDLDLTELNIPQAVVSEGIQVKIPRFTYIDLPEQRHALDPPAALFKSRPSKPSGHDKPGRVEASPRSNHFSARLLRDGLSRSVLKNTSEPRRNVTKLTSLEHQSRTGRPEVFTAPETRGSRGRGNQAKKASRPMAMAPGSTKVTGARARYEEKGPANENHQTHGASTMRALITSPQTTTTPSTTTDSFHLSSSPKVTAHHARHHSSPRQWTDYANHTSKQSQQESPVRSAPRRSRGGTMSRRALSSFPVHRGTLQRQSTGPVARPSYQWTTWVEIHVILFRLSPTISTGDLWSNFHDEGNITFIEIFEDSSGSRTGKAKIKFR